MFLPGSKKIILNIGDEGAVLTYINSGKLERRMFVQSPNSEECEELKKFISSHRKVPVYMLVDILDQSYNIQSIPPVSSFTARSLVRRKLDKDFNPNDIKSALLQGRNDTGRKDWNYLFTSMPSMPPLSEWIDLVNEMPNRFAGIYLLPLESESVVRDLSKTASPDKGKSTRWKIIVTHDKVGGVRQTVFKDFKFVMTRINQPVGTNDPVVIAGNVEQDLLNTIEFVRRVGFDEKEGLEIFLALSDKVKSSLEQNKIGAKSLILLTPMEMAEKLGLKGLVEPEDAYSDVVLAAHFAGKTKKIHRLTTKQAEAQDRISLYHQALMIAGSSIALILMVAAVYQIASIISVRSGISTAKTKKDQLVAVLDSLKKESAELPVNPETVVSNTYYFNLFKTNEMALIDNIKMFSQVKEEGFEAKTVSIKISPTTPAQPVVNTGENLGISPQPVLVADYTIEMIGKISGVEQIIENTQALVTKITLAYPDYEVKFDNLPNKDIINANITAAPQGKGPRSYHSFKANLIGPKMELRKKMEDGSR